MMARDVVVSIPFPHGFYIEAFGISIISSTMLPRALAHVYLLRLGKLSMPMGTDQPGCRGGVGGAFKTKWHGTAWAKGRPSRVRCRVSPGEERRGRCQPPADECYGGNRVKAALAYQMLPSVLVNTRFGSRAKKKID